MVISKKVFVAIEANGIKTKGENLNCKLRSLFTIVAATKAIKKTKESQISV
jgi:hypothetical protein